MAQIFHIARNAFRECAREPIFLVLLVAALVIIGLSPGMALFAFREQIKMVVDSSMATTMVFGLVAAVLCASHTVAREMRNGTALLLLSKPVTRWVFILGKTVGVIGAMTVFVVLCHLATLISIRVAKDQFQLEFATMYIYFGLLAVSMLFGAATNYVGGKSFAANAILAMCVLVPAKVLVLVLLPGGDDATAALNFEVVPALVLVLFAIWSMATITVALSTRLDMVANLTICSIIFVVGLMSNYFFAAPAADNAFFALVYALIPNWQFFWMADALASRTPIPGEYVALGFVYVLAHIIFCVLLATALFVDKEAAAEIS